MEIIVGHMNTDFDSLASMVAASRLYPEAIMVLPGTVAKGVRRFLNLYRDSFDFKTLNNIDIKQVKKIIIVDTNSKSRLDRKLSDLLEKPDVDITVYDHHPKSEDMIETNNLKLERIGACVTTLVREIQKLNIEISPLEATVMLLGIYADTNCLTFESTTAEDAYTVGFLLSKGANLEVVEEYLSTHLSTEQRELLALMNKSTKVIDVKGFQIAISAVKLDEYVENAAFLTGKLLQERDADAFFSILRMGDKTYIIGRSDEEEIDVGFIMGFFGGGGHPGAGSAKTSEEDTQQISCQLEDILNNNILSVTRAKDIMSTPVKTVTEDTSINEVGEIILRYGHSGFPVLRKGELCGIISRRDVEKAIYHGFGHSPVKAYMTKRVVTVNPDTPVKTIEDLLVEHNIGRLPVIRGNELMGIVTRTDIIATLFGENSKYWGKKNRGSDFSKSSYKLNNLADRIKNLPERVAKALTDAGRIADEEGFVIYVVGGFVRDLILGIENLDIDIVAEGDAVKFAQILAEKCSAQITKHEKFNTATLVMEDGLKIDVVTARREYYEHPAALPTVETGTIKDDLFRRDFTVNSMAIKLNSSVFGDIVDYYGGRKDLEQGVIRILYNLSFVEDPTRIMRAIRFEQRYGFKMDEKTQYFAVKAIETGVLDGLSQERIDFEFLAMLREKEVFAILQRMMELGLLEKIYPEIEMNGDVKWLLKSMEKELFAFKKRLNHDVDLDRTLIYLMILHSNISSDNAGKLSERLKITREYKNQVLVFVDKKDRVLSRLSGPIDISDYDIYNELKELSTEALFVLCMISRDDKKDNRIIRYINYLKNIKTAVTGKDLKKLGQKPGPKFAKILEKVLEEKINGRVETYEDELLYVRKIIEEEIEKKRGKDNDI
ncbi:MAG: CBS domain-containing protein [Clostridium sp.]|jgi:tRNA nucleotidyltransferase (CCA-adding enzyme)|nr:CBS domain-containing protein [Clostridium sp.]